MGWGAAIAAIFAVLLPLLQYWLGKAPERKQEAANDLLQDNRQDIAIGNVAAIESRIDRLLDEPDSGAAGEPSPEDVERRISQL